MRRLYQTRSRPPASPLSEDPYEQPTPEEARLAKVWHESLVEVHDMRSPAWLYEVEAEQREAFRAEADLLIADHEMLLMVIVGAPERPFLVRALVFEAMVKAFGWRNITPGESDGLVDTIP